MNKRTIGAEYENKAAYILQKKGYCILEKNYRTRYGEIDLIARKNQTIVIVEVKYRSSNCNGDPAEAVTKKKQRTICCVTLEYLMRHPDYCHMDVRFDVICLYGNDTYRHLEHAFLFCR